MQSAFYASAEFWVAVAFAVVVGGAFKRVVRGIGAALDMRAEKIKAKLDEARRLREEAQHLLAEYQRKQRDAMREAETIVARAQAEAARQKKESLAELEEATRRREAQALSRIAQAEAQAIAEVRNLAIDIAVAATRRLMAENLDPKRAGALVDQAILELPLRLQ
ncbi:MAG: F-type H+-transporting ATPase subunit b [Rhodospirillaceae bacterium]|nr:MAG: F-type H+-transporting ATPase subunit b [Rhodospirillaceae bacterium]